MAARNRGEVEYNAGNGHYPRFDHSRHGLKPCQLLVILLGNGKDLTRKVYMADADLIPPLSDGASDTFRGIIKPPSTSIPEQLISPWHWEHCSLPSAVCCVHLSCMPSSLSDGVRRAFRQVRPIGAPRMKDMRETGAEQHGYCSLGPPTAPVIGNVHQIPTKGSYLK